MVAIFDLLVTRMSKSVNTSPAALPFFGLPLTPTSQSVNMSPSVFFGHKNTGLVLKLRLLPCIEAEI